ncbi:hypothetical protein BH10ACI4_BH10ACI4_13760 [soil metagenome]
MPTNDDLKHQHSDVVDSESPGYETTDANVGGVAVFLAGLFGFVLIFFGVCFLLGRVINTQLAKQDGEPNKWHGGPEAGAKQKRENLASNPEMQQRELQKMTAAFPTPRLDIDDGNQSTADLHAREDLFLDNYSVSAGSTGTIRIPINRAMQLIAERGLPVNAAAAGAAPLAGDVKPEVQAPLTTGFARTGYEIDVMESRAQKMSFAKAEGATHSEAAPAK